MKRKLSILLAAAASLVLLAACGSGQSKTDASGENSSEEKLQVVATNSIIADMAKEIGGELIALHSIVPVGTDPHEYEPLPQDIQKASEADVVLYNGLNLETGNGWFEKLMDTAGKKENTDYFAVSRTVTPMYLSNQESSHTEDPHAWLDISNGIAYSEEIARIFAEKDLENKEKYLENSEAYTEKLKELDQTAKAEFSDIPEEKRLLVTSEGAFKYFSKAYGLTAAYIWEINTESQGTPEQMKTIIDTVKSSDVPSLFVETSVDARSMERLSKEADLPIYSKIFTDSVAEKGEDGDSYYTMMKWNLEKIHEGLSQ
ncbi:metal ABC transporter substrate-binding protein [Enterococcus sp. BWR-S5]|uniref:metal ABC transporter substrate-binding protein n=1 Tax=Enterococcus sp. BWR-S5 TaxID=2787714 RepID=UPI0019208DB5|nr:metal ABC transporter substrate-binding protein [Enterococcus sp. BWR-S5]MBL1225425.1 metal ABC transporter substrate-binding protein [Enterococcus sp. BWR-S5]